MQHHASNSSLAKGPHHSRLLACVIRACQAPNSAVPSLVAKVKPFPRNPRVRVATARCWDVMHSLAHSQGRGSNRDAISQL
jgi:hypothetical protein